MSLDPKAIDWIHEEEIVTRLHCDPSSDAGLVGRSQDEGRSMAVERKLKEFSM
jgi:hypothetical protein